MIITNAKQALAILRGESYGAIRKAEAFSYLDRLGAFADIDAMPEPRQTLADEIRAYDGPDAPETDYDLAASAFRMRTDLSTLADFREIHRLDLEYAIHEGRAKCGAETPEGPCTRIKGHNAGPRPAYTDPSYTRCHA